MKPVIIESPYAGAVHLNKAYLQACIRDCLSREETPYASHQMLTEALSDDIPEERMLGISAGLHLRQVLLEKCDAVVAYYLDLGWSNGMRNAYMQQEKRPVRQKKDESRRHAFHPPECTMECCEEIIAPSLSFRELPSSAWARIYDDVLRADENFRRFLTKNVKEHEYGELVTAYAKTRVPDSAFRL